MNDEMITDEMIAAARNKFIAVSHESYFPSNDQIRCVLEAAEKAAWRPISEAPRDGTEVLLLDERTNIQIVAGWEGSREPDDAPTFGWKTLDGMSYMTQTFTRFRPLPSPPEAP